MSKRSKRGGKTICRKHKRPVPDYTKPISQRGAWCKYQLPPNIEKPLIEQATETWRIRVRLICKKTTNIVYARLLFEDPHRQHPTRYVNIENNEENPEIAQFIKECKILPHKEYNHTLFPPSLYSAIKNHWPIICWYGCYTEAFLKKDKETRDYALAHEYLRECNTYARYIDYVNLPQL